MAEERVAHPVGNFTNKKGAGSGVLYNPEDSILAPFFGDNIPGKKSVAVNEHPCAGYSRTVHSCLDQNDNKYDFCQSVTARFELCLREQGL